MGSWLYRMMVFLAGTGGMLTLVQQVESIWEQQHCEPLLRR